MKPLHPVSSPGACPALEDLSAFYLGQLASDSLQGLAEDLEQSVKGFQIDNNQLALDEAELKALPNPAAKDFNAD